MSAPRTYIGEQQVVNTPSLNVDQQRGIGPLGKPDSATASSIQNRKFRRKHVFGGLSITTVSQLTVSSLWYLDHHFSPRLPASQHLQSFGNTS